MKRIYTTPPGELLTPTPANTYTPINGSEVAQFINGYGIPCKCVKVTVAPQLTHYDIDLIDIRQYSETKIKNIIKALGARTHTSTNLAKSSIADFAVDIVRQAKADLYLRTGLFTTTFNNASRTSCALGVDTNNRVITLDIATAPHVLIAGTTGSGKSVLLNTIICSLLYKATPHNMRFIMIDPKQVEMAVYKNLDHLYQPIVTNTDKAVDVLEMACFLMYRRYAVMAKKGYKVLSDSPDELFPRLVIVIDELADLMLTHKRVVESYIVRIAQLGRAAGVHLIIATQRPTANIITGLIKANIPCKIALSVSSISDSIVILNHGGAEKLTGRGDAIIKKGDSIEETRFQTLYTPDQDIRSIVKYYNSNFLDCLVSWFQCG